MTAIADRIRELSIIRRSVEIVENLLTEFGYERIETPILQPAELFLTRAGDQIVDHLLTLEHRDELLALRPEFTSPAIAAYLQSGTAQSVVRWSFNGPVFEDNPAQERLQSESVGAELLGMPGRYAEAEIIALAGLAAERMGIADYEIVIGHVGLTRYLLNQFGLDTRAQRLLLNYLNHQREPLVAETLQNWLEKFISPSGLSGNGEHEDQSRILQALMDTTHPDTAPVGGRSRDDILERLLRKQQRYVRHENLLEAVSFLVKYASMTVGYSENWQETIMALPAANEQAQVLTGEIQQVAAMVLAYGIDQRKLVIKPALARSWDYYSGTVFELRVNGAIFAGGGRYDDFAALLGAAGEVPAVGLAFYLNNVISDNEFTAGDQIQTLKIQLTPASNLTAAVRWAQELRRHGQNVTVVEEPSNNAYPLQGEHLIVDSKPYGIDDIHSLIDLLKDKTAS
ncbi:MAG: ATP phosphoribosyltransferase regulatory subunit [Anaerolineae bacterium]|nr:ATP phosphoribosyltransferase regulatory subunit [Anaerolineae bacterium]